MKPWVRAFVWQITNKRENFEVPKISPYWWTKRAIRGKISEPMFTHCRGNLNIDYGNIYGWRCKHFEVA